MKTPEIKRQENLHRFTVAFNEQNPSITLNKELLGNKGLRLVEMTQMGLPIPQGFIITTDAWRQYADHQSIPTSLWQEITDQVGALNKVTNLRFGDPQRPLFVSARSGASVSMPAILQTIINIGINDQTVETLTDEIGEHAAWESYFELITAIGTQAYDIEDDYFKELVQKNLRQFGLNSLSQLPPEAVRAMVTNAKHVIVAYSGHAFPEDPMEQLQTAVVSVFHSWDSPIAKAYQKQFNVPYGLGTAVTIQQMVWGNSQTEGAGSGVMLTRDPQLFSDQPIVEFAPHAQGTLVVGESNTYQKLSLNELPKAVQQEFQTIGQLLESHYMRPQDIEFTHDGKKLWVLQTRDAPVSPLSWFRFLEESVARGWKTQMQAERLIPANQLRALLTPDLDPEAKAQSELLAKGLPMSLGNATGRAIKHLGEAEQFPGEPVILAGQVTQKDFIQLPDTLVGLAADNGSLGSHISRMAAHTGYTRNIPIIFGVKKTRDAAPGEFLTIDGSTGEVFAGNISRLASGSHMITPQERTTIEEWLKKQLENPWAYATEGDDINALTQLAQNALKQAQENFVSPKAHEITVLREMMDQNICIAYTPLKSYDAGSVRTLLTEILETGDDATVRTCHNPPWPGGGPWVLLTNNVDIDRFFQDPAYSPKHGGYPLWITHPNLTEVIVGRIPKDKLNPNPAIQREHCTWTLTCTDTEIVLQIRPFSPQLRSHEEASQDDLITIKTSYNPKTSRLNKYMVTTGNNLLENEEARAFTQLVGDTVFEKWWIAHQLPERLAAIARVFPQPNFSIPVLEGQARINQKDKSTWCKIYGIKTDEQTEA